MNAATLQLMIELISQSQRLAQQLRTAHAEGRELTSAELDAIIAESDAARERLQSQIDQARAEGR